MYREFGTEKDVRKVIKCLKETMTGLDGIFYWNIKPYEDTVEFLLGVKEFPEMRAVTKFLAVFTESLNFEVTVRGRVEEMIQLLLNQRNERSLYNRNKYLYSPSNNRDITRLQPKDFTLFSKREQDTEEFIRKEKLPPLPNEELEVEFLSKKEGIWGKRTYWERIKGVPIFLESER